jgi:hypothetical protein
VVEEVSEKVLRGRNISAKAHLLEVRPHDDNEVRQALGFLLQQRSVLLGLGGVVD